MKGIHSHFCYIVCFIAITLIFFLPCEAGQGDKAWYVLCNKKSGDVVYSKHPDPTRHYVMAGPYSGPRTAEGWILDNCPRARCATDGACAKAPVGGGKWNVLCNKKTGAVTFTKHRPGSPGFHVMAGDFRGEPEARLWQEQNCPLGRCNTRGQCVASPVAVRPGQGGWYVTCDLPSGNVAIGKNLISTSSNKVLAGPYLGEPDARLWVDQNFPSWRCNSQGRYLSKEFDGPDKSGFGMLGQEGGEADEGGFGMQGSEGDDDSGGSAGFGLLGVDSDETSGAIGAAKPAQTDAGARPAERGPGAEAGEFATPGSVEAQRAMDETDTVIRPKGERFAAEWNSRMNNLGRKQARQQAEANQFLKDGLTATGQVAGDILAANIKRKANRTPQASQLPYDLSKTPGPVWTKDGGWGGKGDKLKRCRENYAALQAARNDTKRFRRLLGAARGCGHYKKAQWSLAALERQDRCPALRTELQAADQANDIVRYLSLVNKAQIYECQEVYQWARGRQGAVAKRARAQKERKKMARTLSSSGISQNGGGTVEGGPGGETAVTSGSTMRYADCLKKLCPECSQGIGLMFEAVGSGCEGCKRRKHKTLNECAGLGYDSGRYKTEWYVVEHLWYNPKTRIWEPTRSFSVEHRNDKAKQGYRVVYGPAFRDQCMRRREDLNRQHGNRNE